MSEPHDRQQRTRQLLREMMQQPEEKISLAEAALLIAAAEYPDLDRSQYVCRLDVMAGTVGRQVGGETDPFKIIDGINHYLFEEEGFGGNAEEYYDPRNSFLNEVLDRKTGIPITLSALYLEIAARLRFPLVGVGMPGHFLVKHPFGIFIDPFSQGRILTEDDCRAQMHRLLGDSVPFDKSYLDGVSKLHIVTRILNNLRSIYQNSRQLQKALDFTEMALDLHPESLEAVKQKVSLLLQLRRFTEGLAVLTSFLDRNPRSEEAEQLQEMIVHLRKALAQMN